MPHPARVVAPGPRGALPWRARMMRDPSALETRDRYATDPIAAGDAEVPALTIAYHPDLSRVGERASLYDLVAANTARLSREGPLFAQPRASKPRPLGDSCVSRSPIRLSRSPDGGLEVSLHESRTRLSHRGQVVRGALSLSAADLRRGAVIELGGGVVLVIHFVDGGGALSPEIEGLAGDSDGIGRVRADIARVADLELSVLLRGETGTGKELVARAIHDTGPRRKGPFVAVNLAAIPASLAASEMFGAEKGAYTGAVRTHGGYFEAARGGTLFLDEVGEAAPELQVLLLRALETGEIQGVGATRTRKADVRVIAATDADLDAKIRDGGFRAPLLHRLAGYEIWTPPLRSRRDDIARLLLRFLGEELSLVGEAARLAPSPAGAPWLPASLVARLVDLEWPGNVRQLRNVARQLVIGARGRARLEIGPAVERLLEARAPSLPPPAREPTSAPRAPTPTPVPPSPPAPERRRPADVSEDDLRKALRVCRWDLAATADRLGVSRASMYVLIERTPGLRTAGDVTPDEITRCHQECGGDLGRMVDKLEVSERALRRRLRELGLG